MVEWSESLYLVFEYGVRIMATRANIVLVVSFEYISQRSHHSSLFNVFIWSDKK